MSTKKSISSNIRSYDARKKRNEAIALLKLISFAENDVTEGRMLTSEELKKKTSEVFLKKWS